LELLNLTLQQALPNEGFAIGPSYLMPREGEPNLEGIWRHAIMPLIEERFYGIRPAEELEGEFGLEAMRTRLRANGHWPERRAQAEPEPALP
jgi:hypothetical protein